MTNTKTLLKTFVASLALAGSAEAATVGQHVSLIAQTPKHALTARIGNALVEHPYAARNFLEIATTRGLACKFDAQQKNGMRAAVNRQNTSATRFILDNSCKFKTTGNENTSSINHTAVAAVALAAATGVAFAALARRENEPAATTNAPEQAPIEEENAATSPERTPTEVPVSSPVTAPSLPSGDFFAEKLGLSYSADRENRIVNSIEYKALNVADGNQNNHPLSVTNISRAYGYGLSGAGQKIALIDNGFLVDQVDLVEKTSGKTAVYGTPEAKNHGTHTATIAAGARNDKGGMGVAYGADLYLSTSNDISALEAIRQENPVVLSNSWSYRDGSGNRFSHRDIEKQIENNPNVSTLAEAISVVRRSDVTKPDFTATPEAFLVGYYDRLVDKLDELQDETVIVFSNSNGYVGHDAPTFTDRLDQQVPSALPYFAPELREAWIAVSSYDFESNTIRSEADVRQESQSCGVTAEYCLVHDGEQILAASGQGKSDFRISSGTSQAVPQVAGAIALLAEAFPKHTPAELTSRLLASANNSWFESEGVTDFGNGVEHGFSYTYGHGTIDFAKALRPIGSTNINVKTKSGAIENIDFAYDAKAVSANATLANVLQNGLSSINIDFKDGLNGEFSNKAANLVALNTLKPNLSKNLESFLSAFFDEANSQPQTQGFAFVGGTEFSTSIKSNATAALGSNLNESGVDGLGLKNVNAISLGTQNVKVTALKSTDDQLTDVVAGFTNLSFKPSQTTNLSIIAGGVQDSGLLGSALTGALKLDGSRTFVTTAQFKKNFTETLSLSGTATFATTNVQIASASLINDASAIHSLAASAQLDWKTAKSKLSLGLSTPLKAVSGALNVDTFSAETQSFNAHKIDLAAGKTELKLNAFGATKLNDNLELRAGTSLRLNADHRDQPAVFDIKLGLKFSI